VAPRRPADHEPDSRGLGEYRRKRDARRTPEPVPEREPSPDGAGNRFVIQEHHARSLHWDLRLERDGVLVSWAVPRGLPPDPAVNHLAVHTEDHPMEYATFSGEIPAGEYGGGTMTIWDSGRYETEKWSDSEVKFVLHGGRAEGRFVLFRTDGGSMPGKGGGKDNWMIHRMDGLVRPGWRPLPGPIAPMLATPGRMPAARDDDAWHYEFGWPGVRALAEVDGGRVRLFSAQGQALTASFPELRGLGEDLGLTQVLLDGVLVAFGGDGRPDLARARGRLRAGGTDARTLSRRAPVALLAFDLLHLDGEPQLDLPLTERRHRLEQLGLAGPAWKTAPSFEGGGAAVRAAASEQGLEQIVAKRASSRYEPGTKSKHWREIKA
jgi:bifunctional non-homologous end joining protein LigD